MKQNWLDVELQRVFTVTSEDKTLVKGKTKHYQILFLALYKACQEEKAIPNAIPRFSSNVISFISDQLGIDQPILDNIPKRSQRYLLQELRNRLYFKRLSESQEKELKHFLANQVLTESHHPDFIRERLYHYLEDKKIAFSSDKEEEELIRSAQYLFERVFFASIFKKLPQKFKASIDKWLDLHGSPDLKIGLTELKRSPGAIGVKSALQETQKLKTILSFHLPDQLTDQIVPKILRKYYQRAVSQSIWEFKRQPEEIRYSLIALFLDVRRKIIIDDLIELLIQITHKIKINSEKRVEKTLVKEIRKIYGKEKILLDMATTSLEHPDGVIAETLYPVVGGKERLEALAKELSSKREYNERVYSTIRRSYSSHYRQMIPHILNLIDFKSNNTEYQPLIQAVQIIKKYIDSKLKYLPQEEAIPFQGVIPNQLQDIVIEEKNDTLRFNRINYEICVFQSLRDRLRCKEIWIPGADRYRNPDEDLPQDFQEKRNFYYEKLQLPLCSEAFTSHLQVDLRNSLIRFNQAIPKNPKVKILRKSNGWISVSPSSAQPEPPNLHLIKDEIAKKWSMVNLLDVIKEVFLRVPLIKHFKSVSAREMLTEDQIRKRVILALYGLGTNTGLKRVAVGNREESYRNLLHICQNYITKDNLKNAISDLVNALFKARNPKIWGFSTTACASDSKHFGSWDQNLMTEWHNRYHGRGVMIYWHVEEKSVCIHSQLKKCSSSEVSAMIEGVLRHCTEMEVEKNYVDTHGQSVVAFAFCHLLGFELLPRIKNIHSQKLRLPETGLAASLDHLEPILAKRSINWDLIRQQYDQMVKYATALRLGTADTEAILKRFTKQNIKHPTYLALCELGKVVKTNFLCKYLSDEKMRIEVNRGLNIIENWNGANDFILFGKGREFASNNLEHQEITALSLHLIQNCLVYINTLMFQDILSKKKWLDVMTPEDFRAITPLIYEHVTPYGSFKLNMKNRIHIGESSYGAD
ncbi:MAG: Tn3 family transposase [Chlamydiota bacterium]